jgi:hypothetical protein
LLDLEQASRLVAQLREAERTGKSVTRRSLWTWSAPAPLAAVLESVDEPAI